MTPGATQASPVPQPTVIIGLMTYVVPATGGFTFGRDPASTHCLDPDDLGVSRSAGAIVYQRRHWWIVNASKTHPLTILEGGLRETLMAGRSRLLAESTTVWVAGRFRTYALHIQFSEQPLDYGLDQLRPGAPLPAGLATWSAPELSAVDRAVCELLFEPLFRTDGRSDPIPTTYLAVATRLGLPESTVRRRVDNLRARLTRLGVVNLDGRTALTNLGEYLISHRMIGNTRSSSFTGTDAPSGVGRAG